jgi:hypothetical protein
MKLKYLLVPAFSMALAFSVNAGEGKGAECPEGKCPSECPEGAQLKAKADQGGDKSEAKAKRKAEMLKKWDKNGDGKLDDAEKAAMNEAKKKKESEKS